MQLPPDRHILVIDDEDIVRQCCLRTLKPAGYLVDTASSGQEGLDMLDSKHYDLVLVDLKMPSMDGEEVITSIKQNHPDVPFLIVSGYITAETTETADALGAKDYVEKPFEPKTLLKHINHAFGIKN